MKNKIIYILIVIFLSSNISIADEYNFEVSKIEIKEKGNIIIAYDGNVLSKNGNLKIFAQKFKYIKNKNYLEAFNGKALFKKENLKLQFNSINIKNNNILTASDGIKINDLENSLQIDSEKIVLDRNKNIIISLTESTLKDKNKNFFKTNKFEYNYNKEELKIFEAYIKDYDENNYKVEYADINLISNTLVGSDITINLNNKSFNIENEPRLSGDRIIYSGNITNISNGVFTACKENDSCPPWQLSAEEITHDREKKSINYKNVWLNIYDVPVVYFPKFFHPDPTVKRQSGFLMPTFKNSPNKNTFFSIPYYKVLSESKDLTITPRFYAKDQLLVQNEYREKNKNSEIISDFSILTDKKGSESHLFLNVNTEKKFKNFEKGNIELKIEQVSNDTYLKANKLASPIINDYDVIENSLQLNLSSDNTDIDTKFIVYENLNRKSSDKYEYIFPKVKLVKNLQNNTNLNGKFKFETDNFIHNYNTNIYERINTNNLIFSSTPKINKEGFKNNFEFIIKNSNTDSQKSNINKEGNDHYLSGLFQFNSNYPLTKKNEKYNYLLKPKISLKLNPGHTKDLSKYDHKIDVNNIFNLDRISSSETLEGGTSIAYGADYLLTKKDNNKEILSLKFANNLRLKKNDDLERNNQLNDKTSNFFGQIIYSPMSFVTAKYDLSVRNNLSDINFQNLTTEIKFNKFTNTFDYLRQDGDKNSYFLNKTSFNLDNSNNISFATRENLKTDLTEYYNLVYQYKNDCLAASIEYQKDFYSDRDIKPAESIFLKLTIIPFGTTSSPNLKQ